MNVLFFIQLMVYWIFITWRYSISSSVSSFNTATIISSGNLRLASYRGDMVSCMTSAHANIASWAMDQVLLLVLSDVLYSCIIPYFSFLDSSSSGADHWDGSTLGGVTVRSSKSSNCELDNLRGTGKPHPNLLARTTSL